jgi:hypothetical protein
MLGLGKGSQSSDGAASVLLVSNPAGLGAQTDLLGER